MIIIKNYQLTNETISALNTLIDMDINAKIAFRLMRIIKEISTLVEIKIDMEKKILEKYLERDQYGNPLPVIGEDGNVVEGGLKIKSIEYFNREMSELMSVETEINYDKIRFDDMGLQSAKIKDLIKIDFLFE